MDRVYSVIDQLSKTTSSLDKKAILRKVESAEEDLKKILYLTYNPYLNSYVSDTSWMTGMRGTFYSSVGQSIDEFEELFYKLHERKLSGNDAKDAINKFLKQCRWDVATVYIRALTRDLKCGIAVKTINSVFPNLIPEFNVQLASTYEIGNTYKNSIWYASPKMDGVRGVFKNGCFLSRKGREFVGLNTIHKEVEELSQAISVDLIDGEIYIPGKNFNQIQSIISGDYAESVKDKLQYHIFLAANSSTSSTVEMLRKLDEMDKYQFPHLRRVKYNRILNDPKSITAQASEYVSQGYEGVVLRHPTTFHSEKRDKNLVKFKFFNEVDVVITGIREGDGKYEGVCGSLSYVGNINGLQIIGEVGSGLTDYVRKEIMSNTDKYLGKKMTVKFQDITPGEPASLRFPVILGFKEDR